ncbi:MAG: DUF1800 family protein, partial [Phycisphaerales bacterium]|nr:DUF1800 family protein [Phycisphaerales bacterium]
LDLSVSAGQLADATSNMGQRLLEPPSVAGWETHRGWLDSATMLVRLNAARVAADDLLDAPATCARHDLSSPTDARRFAIERTLGASISPALRSVIDDVNGTTPDVLRRSLGLLLATPEYQMA